MLDLRTIATHSPDETFQLGERIAGHLHGGEILLLSGGLGAGKTLFTKGVLGGLGFDVDEVTSPSFTLVNLYRTERFDVYHIDLWRAGDAEDSAFSVGLGEILEDPSAVVIVEWAEKLGNMEFDRPVYRITITGDGDLPRKIEIMPSEQISLADV